MDGLYITLFFVFLNLFIRTLIRNGQGTIFILKIKASVAVSIECSSFQKPVMMDVTEKWQNDIEDLQKTLMKLEILLAGFHSFVMVLVG